MSDTNNNSKNNYKVVPIKNTFKLEEIDLDEMAKAQGVAEELVKAFMKLEEELLCKVFKHYTGEDVDLKNKYIRQSQGKRITIVAYENEFDKYMLQLDGIHIGNVERDFVNGAINFTPVDPLTKFVVTDNGIELRE